MGLSKKRDLRRGGRVREAPRDIVLLFPDGKCHPTLSEQLLERMVVTALLVPHTDRRLCCRYAPVVMQTRIVDEIHPAHTLS